jgi:hypothetical protein
MPARFVIPAILQIAVPLAMLGWQAWGRDTTLISWSLKQTAVWSYIYTTSVAGLWLAAPWYVPHALMLISISLAARTLPDALRLWRPPAHRRQWMMLTARASTAALCVLGVGFALEGRTLPAETAVDLEFPLQSGHYYVANGGSTELVNAHVRLLTGERFRRYRGASYGLDVLALNRFGTRASGFAPRDPARYAIFGDAIYAPCEGIVVRVEDYLPDLRPPDVDRSHMAGNFVMLECGDAGEFHVLLAHMRSGSVRVHPGDYVTLDVKLGEVGNSGNSDEPHLHVHAQRPGRIWDLFTGDPLPIRFNGRYLVRNDRLTIFAAGDNDIIDD